MGNKVVTRIQGLHRYGIPIEDFATVLKIKCASACTIDSINSTDNYEIIVQGKKTNEVLRGLEAYGINSLNSSVMVSIIDKIKKRK